MLKISPSVLNCDFLTFNDDIKKLEDAKVDMLHLDVMDGIFVPNISFGVPVIKSIKKHTSIPLDVHLMIDRPDRYIKQFAEYADILGFHYEAGSDIENTLNEIHSYDIKNCLTIKPETPAEDIFEYLTLCDMVLVMSVEPGFGGQKFMRSSLEKCRKLRAEAERQYLDIDIEIDGGINGQTAELAYNNGANVLVMGSYLFSDDNINSKIESVRGLENK